VVPQVLLAGEHRSLHDVVLFLRYRPEAIGTPVAPSASYATVSDGEAHRRTNTASQPTSLTVESQR